MGVTRAASKKTSKRPVEDIATPKGKAVVKNIESPEPALSAVVELSLLDKVQAALHDSHGYQVASVRAKEAKTIEDFLHGHLENRSAGSMYVSGCPGSGKTSLFKSALADLPKWLKSKKIAASSCNIIELNAMTHKDAKSVFSSIAENMGSNMSEVINAGGSITEMCEHLHSLFSNKTTGRSKKPKKVTNIVIIDEVDQIFDNSQGTAGPSRSRRGSACSASSRSSGKGSRAVLDLQKMSLDPLMQLFSLPAKAESNIVLIGIANSADLFERMMPLLKLTECQPVSVVFEPYGVDELRQIITTRLKAASNDEELPFFDQRAVELLVKKMATFHGDCRQALDACRRALVSKSGNIRVAAATAESKLVESKRQRVEDTLSEASTATAASATGSLGSINEDDEWQPQVPQITITDVAGVLGSVLKQDGGVAAEFLSNMPLQQKLVLYAACKVAERLESETLPGPQIMKDYSLLCRKRGLTPHPRSVLLEQLQCLEAAGHISVADPPRSLIRRGSNPLSGGGSGCGAPLPSVTLLISSTSLQSTLHALAPSIFAAAANKTDD